RCSSGRTNRAPDAAEARGANHRLAGSIALARVWVLFRVSFPWLHFSFRCLLLFTLMSRRVFAFRPFLIWSNAARPTRHIGSKQFDPGGRLPQPLTLEVPLHDSEAAQAFQLPGMAANCLPLGLTQDTLIR